MQCKSDILNQAVEKSYLMSACGLNMMEGESNESLYRKGSMSIRDEEMNCGVVEVVECIHVGGLVTWGEKLSG